MFMVPKEFSDIVLPKYINIRF